MNKKCCFNSVFIRNSYNNIVMLYINIYYNLYDYQAPSTIRLLDELRYRKVKNTCLHSSFLFSVIILWRTHSFLPIFFCWMKLWFNILFNILYYSQLRRLIDWCIIPANELRCISKLMNCCSPDLNTCTQFWTKSLKLMKNPENTLPESFRSNVCCIGLISFVCLINCVMFETLKYEQQPYWNFGYAEWW